MPVRARRIVVLGGGFAGVECVRRLERRLGGGAGGGGAEIILVSEDNFLLFTPMLPQVASGMIETRHIVTPIRKIIKRSAFYEGRVRNIDPYGKVVDLWGGGGRRGISIRYDYLVVALGSETNFFGMSDLERNAYRMKTLNDAVQVRNRAIDMLERAENETDPILRRGLLTFVVVGGGFAGVETAGEVMDLLLDAVKHYRGISAGEIRVVVLEAMSGILPGFSRDLAGFAQDKLAERGVDIRLRTAVVGFDGEEVITRAAGPAGGGAGADPEAGSIQARTVIWTAGVAPANTIKRSLFKTVGGKIAVDENLEAEGFPGVFAIGDCALCLDRATGKPVPPTAQAAEAQAKVAAHNLQALLGGGEKKGFEYRSRGQMAVIGKRAGIALFLGMNIHGFVAWVLWRNVYLSKMPTWGKRLRVLLDWTADVLSDRDISRLKTGGRGPDREYRGLDEVDGVW